MRFFSKHRTQEAPRVPLELSTTERIAQAERRVKEADERATVAAKRLYELQIKHNLSLDNLGAITKCSLIGGATETDLAEQVRALVTQRTAALQEFHFALRVWAGLK